MEVARANADCWLQYIGDDGVAPWDFDAPETGEHGRSLVDTSASAIAVVGLLNLAERIPDEARRKAYAECALRTIATLTTKYLGEGADGWEGTLRGGVYHLHNGLGVNESVMWGEYFFVEALQRVMRLLGKSTLLIGDVDRAFGTELESTLTDSESSTQRGKASRACLPHEESMADEPVIYNGVPVDPEWPATMEESQRKTTYVINGHPLPRIRYGDESEDWGADRGVCHDCAAAKGQYHAFALCDVERCPVCDEQAIGCDCDYDDERTT
jgi:hypothetical protein